jgi:hypothetical protein
MKLRSDARISALLPFWIQQVFQLAIMVSFFVWNTDAVDYHLACKAKAGLCAGDITST